MTTKLKYPIITLWVLSFVISPGAQGYIVAQSIKDYLMDIDGNIYKIVNIGGQEWIAENLNVTRFNDGSEIPYVPDMEKWNRLTSAAYSYYENEISNKNVYGALYNWFAVSSGKICPVGWSVPTDSDWDKLIDYLGGPEKAGGKLKDAGTKLWKSPNAGATNESRFNALPGGYRYGQYWGTGVYYDIGLNGYWWTKTEYTFTHSLSRTLHTRNTKVYRSFFIKNNGFSVRCIKVK